MKSALSVLKAICGHQTEEHNVTNNIIQDFVPSLVRITCIVNDSSVRELSLDILNRVCSVNEYLALQEIIPNLINFLRDEKYDERRSGACFLLLEILRASKNTNAVCPHVRKLLPIVMSLMTDSVKECAESASSIFSQLVLIAPLVKQNENEQSLGDEADQVIDHLIHGKKFPPCNIYPTVSESLKNAGIVLRKYQLEGISWLRFLQRVKLNGALCDSMGLGKTLQALCAVALSHEDNQSDRSNQVKSLVVCPSSVVGHWMNEICRFFPGDLVFRPVALVGSNDERKSIFSNRLHDCNVVVTSYSVLRNDIESLSTVDWTYCILDEGHLLKNPKTSTARSSRRLRARHKLILTGTPVQNHVHRGLGDIRLFATKLPWIVITIFTRVCKANS